jgi:hypothetical protein
MVLYQTLKQGENDEIDGEYYGFEAVIQQKNGRYSFIPLTADEMHSYQPIAGFIVNWIKSIIF